MIRQVWSHLIQRCLSSPREPKGRISKRQEPAKPIRFVRLVVEELEPRVVPSTAPAAPPPSFPQAAIALVIDGRELFLNEYVALTSSAGSNNTIPMQIQQVQANIAFNAPYAQPFSPLLVLDGEIAGYDFVSSFLSQAATPVQYGNGLNQYNFL